MNYEKINTHINDVLIHKILINYRELALIFIHIVTINF